MTTRNLIVAGAVLLATIVCLGAYSWNQRKAAAIWAAVAETAKKQAQEEAQRADEAGKWAEGYKAQADEYRTQSATLSKELADLRRAIPVPRPAPPQSTALASALVNEGFRLGVKVYDDNEPSKLNRADAEKTWVWNQTGAMVPGLTAALGKAESLAASNAQEAQALRFALTYTEEARDDWKRSAGAQQTRADALDKNVKALTKSAKAQTVQKWLMVAGGIAGGYLAGRAIR